MDWQTIRVLTSNLGKYLDQYERGEHVEVNSTSGQEREGVTDEWWVGIRGLTASLANEFHLNMKELTEPGGFTASLLLHIKPAKVAPTCAR